MIDLLVRSEESHAALVALINFLLEVAVLVLVPVAFGEELFAAILTIKPLLAHMDFHVLDNTTFVLEGLAAGFNWTNKRLIRVRFVNAVGSMLSIFVCVA